MNRALQESNWQEFIEVEKILNGDDAFWGLNEDQVVGGGLMKSGHTFFCDELQAVLNSGGASQSQSESCYSIQRTLSCPIAGDVAGVGSSQRKRKAETLKEEVDVKMEKKKMKVYEEEESKFSEQNSNCNSKSTTTAADSCRKHPAASKSDSNSKGGDAPKTDYVHVRARRGQATDSHSLAERVRREKISERMKFLQDLVPGCDKITGKAAMLDEIINYVQSLQRQVELLSMKLAALTPRLNHDIEGNLPKEIYQSILPSSEVNNSGVHFHLHPVVQMPMGVTVNTSDSGLHGGLSVPLTIPDPFIDSHAQQFSWGNEMENPFASSFLPRPFTGEGFMGAGSVKLEMP